MVVEGLLLSELKPFFCSVRMKACACSPLLEVIRPRAQDHKTRTQHFGAIMFVLLRPPSARSPLADLTLAAHAQYVCRLTQLGNPDVSQHCVVQN